MNNSTTPRPIEAQRLAAKLNARWPFLVRHRHIGALVDILIKYEVTDWSAYDITSAIDDWHLKQGWRALGAESQNPLGWFDEALRRALEDGASSRSLDSQQKAELQAIKAREAAKEEALRKVKASEPESPVVQNARDQIKAIIAETRMRRTAMA